MKKIAFVFPPLLPMPAVKGGATETLIQQLIDDNELQGKCRFDIFCRYDEEAEKASKTYKNTRFFYIKEKNTLADKLAFLWFRLRRKVSRGYVPEAYIEEVAAKLGKEKYDAVIVESALRFIPYLKKKTRGKVLLHLHFDVVASNQPNKKEAFACCDGVICVSRFIQKTVRDYEASTKTAVLQNVVDTGLFCRQSHMEQALTLRQRYGIQATDKVVLYAGRLMAVKGVAELVQSFFLAKEAVPELKLLLVGSPVYGQTVLDEFMQQLLQQVGQALDESVFLPGYIPHDQMADYYAMADIAVMPTTGVEEASGLSALEPLSAGCRFIGSDSGGIPEVANCDAAVIVPRGENFVARLAQAIVENAKDTAIFPEDGRSYVVKNHDARDYYHHFFECLQEIV